MSFNTYPQNPFPSNSEMLQKLGAVAKAIDDLGTTKANQITIAPTFSAETAYDIGDIVYFNGLTYRCTNAHEGAWDASDFAATTINNELAALNSNLTALVANTSMTNLNQDITYNYNVVAKIGNVVILSVSLNNVSNGVKIGTVPLGYRPSVAVTFIPQGMSKDANGIYRFSTVTVHTNGDIYAQNDSVATMSVFMGVFMWTV